MGDDSEDRGDWPVVIVIAVVIAGFYFGGLWIGLGCFVIGAVVLGWSKRHDGPFPTNRPKQ